MERAGGSFVPMTYDEPCDGHSDCGHCHVCVRSLRMARGTCHLSCALSGRCPEGMQCDTITERVENDGVDDPVRTMEVCRWRSTTASLRAASR